MSIRPIPIGLFAPAPSGGGLPSFADAGVLITGGWVPTIGGTDVSTLAAAADVLAPGAAAYTLVALVNEALSTRRLSIDPDTEDILGVWWSGSELAGPCGEVSVGIITDSMVALVDDGVSVFGRLNDANHAVTSFGSTPQPPGTYEARNPAGSVVFLVWPRALTIAELDALYAATTFP